MASFLGKIMTSFTKTTKQQYFGAISKDNIEKDLTIVKDTKPKICQLKMRALPITGGIRRFEYGNVCDAKHMVIMFVGGTGSGKSTMINSFANFLFGIEWKDPFRIKVVDENIDADQADSQTQNVTTYTFYKERKANTCNVTIIDTPGFTDTSGKDQQISDQIRELFTQLGEYGINSINAVGFVVEASRARLTDGQRYIYEKVLSPFGKDIKDNIAVLVTFADEGEPRVLDALRKGGLEYKEYFKFNNGATFAEFTRDKSNESNKRAWSLMVESFDKALQAIQLYSQKSLTLSKEVLAERDQLKLKLVKIMDDVEFLLDKTRESSKYKKVIEKHKDKIEKNKPFQEDVDEPFWDKCASVGWNNNCNICSRTCDEDCLALNSARWLCGAFNSITYGCLVCPGGCHYHNHNIEKYRWYKKTRKVTITDKKMKELYHKNMEAKSEYEDMNTNLENEIKDKKEQTNKKVQEMVAVIKRLEEIALKPGLKSPKDYIDDLIQKEANSREDGFSERIAVLEEIKANMAIY